MTRTALLLAALGLSACAPSFPPVARTEGDAAFKARIATAFPPGSPAERLRAVLAAEGFAVAEDAATGLASAVERPGNLPCFSVTRIDWREDRRGRIAAIQAQRHACS